MASLAIAVKTKNKERKIVVEPDFVKSLERAEADCRAGRVTTITSLKDAES
jgi:hypothetical protein